MSTINGSDNSSRQDEVVRKNREDYKQNESEMVKKHQKELRRVTESHYQEIERLKSDYEKQINELKKHSNENISTRDYKYQQDMENMRQLHRKQLQETSGQANRNVDLNRKTAESEVQQEKLRGEERVRELTTDFQQSNRERDEKLTQSLNEVREQQQKSTQSYREKMNEKHKKEMDLITETNQKNVQELQGEYRTYRKGTEARIKGQELRHFQNQTKASEDLTDAVRRERMNQNVIEQNLRKGFQEGLSETRERYEQRMQKTRAEMEGAQLGLSNDVNERVNGEMRSLERTNNNLKDENIRDRVAVKREADQTIRNVKDAYQKNVEVAIGERDEAVRTANEGRSKEIEKVQGKNSKAMVDLNREYLERIELNRRLHNDSMDQLEGDFRARNDMTKSNADQRVRHIITETESDKIRLSEFHEANRNIQEDSHREELKEIRSTHEKDKMEAVGRMKEFIRKQEIQHNDKMASLTVKYEGEIAKLNDELSRMKRQHDEDTKRMTGQFQRQHQSELDTQQIQFQEKIRKLQDQHVSELRTQNMKSQEKLDQFVASIKKS